VAASLCWAKLLFREARSRLLVCLLGAALLLSSRFWFDQAIQLKQYTFDVLMALMPFLLTDVFLYRAFKEGKYKGRLILLALPCLLSYTYPFALFAGAFGWYLFQSRKHGWRLQQSSALVFVLAVAFFLTGIWFSDYQFNLKDCDDYFTYWRSCILRYSFQEGIGSVLRLLAKFLWGWHGRKAGRW